MKNTVLGWLHVLLAAGMLIAIGPIASAMGSKANTIQNKTIVVIGASYAKSWPVTTIDGLAVSNKGAGGEQTHEMLARFDRDVIAARPRAVLIWGHINDIFRSEPEALKAKLVRSRENIRSMVEMARSKGIAVVVATEVTLPASTGWTVWLGKLRGKQNYREFINGHVIEMNQWIRALAAEKKLVLLDFEKVLADQDGTRKREFTTEDGTHLSSKAYDALTRYVQDRKVLN